MENRTHNEDRILILSSLFELEEYLLSTVILWRSKGSIPPLSPGNLMLAMKRIRVGIDAELDQAINHAQGIIEHHRAAWEKKIKAELSMRLRQWRSIVDEILEYGAIDPSYQYNVRVRVIIALLMDALRFTDKQLSEKLLQIDEKLNQIAVYDGFVWNEELEKSFPQEYYPFLYLK